LTRRLARLGPFDGRVGAIAQVGAEHFFITTNTDYIPVPPVQPFNVSVRLDMRYGIDDPSCWPQLYSETFCHLAAMPKPDARADIAVMWWNLQPSDFVPGSASTRGLGKLRSTKLANLIGPVEKMSKVVKDYCSGRSDHSPLFRELVLSMVLSLERLQDLPSTYEQMVFGVTCVQRMYLELDALLNYMTVYKPRMENFKEQADSVLIAACMGAFTSEPRVAQILFSAKLPFWFLRPTYVFAEENILAVVELRQVPGSVMQDILPERPALYTGKNHEKLKAMARTSRFVSWYRDPFADDSPPSALPVQTPQPAPLPPSHGASRSQSGVRAQRYQPCTYEFTVLPASVLMLS
jgi:hypothetical protein